MPLETQIKQMTHNNINQNDHRMEKRSNLVVLADMNSFGKHSEGISDSNDVRKMFTELEKTIQEISKRKSDIRSREVKDNPPKLSSVELQLRSYKRKKGTKTHSRDVRKNKKCNQKTTGDFHRKKNWTGEQLCSMKNEQSNDEHNSLNEAYNTKEEYSQLRENINLHPKNLSFRSNTKNRTKNQNERNTTSRCMDKNTKSQMLIMATKKRSIRTKENKKRREKIERDRIKRLQSNSGESRRARLKRKTQESRMKLRLVQDLLICMTLGTTLHSALRTVQSFREYKLQTERENSAAKLITRQMRLYNFKRQRQRIRSAIYVLGTCFVAKVRLWKKSRRRLASDRLVAFLTKLKEENIKSGGSLALIVKGKKWRAYRIKIILLQNRWRHKLKMIEAQVELIDIQWKIEQYKRTETEIDNIHQEQERKTKLENEELESINRTRRLIKLKNLPKIKYKSREEVKKEHLNGKDLLSIGNIVPIEIRHKIIKETLKHIKKIYRSRVEQYNISLYEYRLGVAELHRRQAFLDGFSDIGMSSDWIWGARKQRIESKTVKNDRSLHHVSINQIQIPIKPELKIILNGNTLSKMIELGANFVNSTRNAWSPEMMQFVIPSYNDIGEKIAQYHFQEIDKVKKNPSKHDGSTH